MDWVHLVLIGSLIFFFFGGRFSQLEARKRFPASAGSLSFGLLAALKKGQLRGPSPSYPVRGWSGYLLRFHFPIVLSSSHFFSSTKGIRHAGQMFSVPNSS